MPRSRAQVGLLLERFTETVKRRGLRLTRQRLAIARRFFESERHQTIDDLYEKILKEVPEIGYATVYRTLKLMEECRIARPHYFGANKVCYEVHEDNAHHDHLICTACGRIIEFEDNGIEALQEAVASHHNFTMMSHRMEIYGTCSECAP